MAAVSFNPIKTMRFAWSGLPAPSQNDTRALQAIAIDSGIMYSTAAMLAAIWWLADAVTPSLAMNTAIKVNDVTSTR